MLVFGEELLKGPHHVGAFYFTTGFIVNNDSLALFAYDLSPVSTLVVFTEA